MNNLDNARKEDIKNKILDLHSGSPKKYRVKYYRKVLNSINRFSKYCNADYDLVKEDVLDALGSSCKYCGEEIDAKNLSGDHIIPLTRGGVSYLDNFQLICNRCNKRKGDLTNEEYVSLLDLISFWDDEAQLYVLRQMSKSDYYGS